MLRGRAQSIRGKLMLAVLAITASALAVAGAAMMVYDLRTYQDRWVSELTAQAEILGRAAAPALAFDDPKSAQEYLSLLKVRPKISAAAIYNAKGKLFARYASGADDPNSFPALPDSEGARVEGKTLVLFRRIVENGEILGTVYLKGNYELMARLRDYLGILAVVMFASLLVALVMSTWLQAKLTRPITDVTEVARRVMANRDFSLRARKTTEDEIGVLVDAFNAMLAEIGQRAQALESEMAERKHAEAELKDLNLQLEQRVAARTAELETANRELEAFSYSVSHDLRAPLRAVIGYAQMLIEDHREQMGEEGLRKLDVITEEAQRMGTLIDDLLAFSRLGRKAMQAADLDMAGLVRATYAQLCDHRPGPKAELVLGTLPRCKGDRVLLGQVWANLLANALKFSSKKEHPVIEVNAIGNEAEHVYFVRDNGAGFDPRYQSKLFGVFQRLHDSGEFPGTGVGLALVQRIVMRHGGRVWAEGAPGEGATFYFTLPKESRNGIV